MPVLAFLALGAAALAFPDGAWAQQETKSVEEIARSLAGVFRDVHILLKTGIYVICVFSLVVLAYPMLMGRMEPARIVAIFAVVALVGMTPYIPTHFVPGTDKSAKVPSAGGGYTPNQGTIDSINKANPGIYSIVQGEEGLGLGKGGTSKNVDQSRAGPQGIAQGPQQKPSTGSNSNWPNWETKEGSKELGENLGLSVPPSDSDILDQPDGNELLSDHLKAREAKAAENALPTSPIEDSLEGITSHPAWNEIYRRCTAKGGIYMTVGEESAQQVLVVTAPAAKKATKIDKEGRVVPRSETIPDSLSCARLP